RVSFGLDSLRYHADSHAVGYAWLRIYGTDPEDQAALLAPIEEYFDAVVDNPIVEEAPPPTEDEVRGAKAAPVSPGSRRARPPPDTATWRRGLELRPSSFSVLPSERSRFVDHSCGLPSASRCSLTVATRSGTARERRSSSSSNVTGGLCRSAPCSRRISTKPGGSRSNRLQRNSSGDCASMPSGSGVKCLRFAVAITCAPALSAAATTCRSFAPFCMTAMRGS